LGPPFRAPPPCRRLRSPAEAKPPPVSSFEVSALLPNLVGKRVNQPSSILLLVTGGAARWPSFLQGDVFHAIQNRILHLWAASANVASPFHSVVRGITSSAARKPFIAIARCLAMLRPRGPRAAKFYESSPSESRGIITRPPDRRKAKIVSGNQSPYALVAATLRKLRVMNWLNPHAELVEAWELTGGLRIAVSLFGRGFFWVGLFNAGLLGDAKGCWAPAARQAQNPPKWRHPPEERFKARFGRVYTERRPEPAPASAVVPSAPNISSPTIST